MNFHHTLSRTLTTCTHDSIMWQTTNFLFSTSSCVCRKNAPFYFFNLAVRMQLDVCSVSCLCAPVYLYVCVRWTSVLCRPAKEISWELLVFTRPVNRGCYQPWSRCMFSFTYIRIQFHIDTHTLTPVHTPQRGSLEVAPTPSPSGPVEGHIFVSRCQGAGVCSCASRSIRFILISRGCPFVCGPVSFQPTPASPPRGCRCVCCIKRKRVKSTNTQSMLLYCSAPSQPIPSEQANRSLKVTGRLS